LAGNLLFINHFRLVFIPLRGILFSSKSISIDLDAQQGKTMIEQSSNHSFPRFQKNINTILFNYSKSKKNRRVTFSWKLAERKYLS